MEPDERALATFESGVENHRLVETDDLRWIPAESIGVWVALLFLAGLALASLPLDAHGDLFGSIFDISMTALSTRSLGLLMLFLGLLLTVRGARTGAESSA